MCSEWSPNEMWDTLETKHGTVATLLSGPHHALVVQIAGVERSVWTVHTRGELVSSGHSESIMPYHFEEAQHLCEKIITELERP